MVSREGIVRVGDVAASRVVATTMSGSPDEVAAAAREIVRSRPLARVRVEETVPLDDWPVAYVLQTVSPDDGRAREVLLRAARPGSRRVRVNPGYYPFTDQRDRALSEREVDLVGTVPCEAHDEPSAPDRARGPMVRFRCPRGHAFWRSIHDTAKG
jgi:hypothetical protein